MIQPRTLSDIFLLVFKRLQPEPVGNGAGNARPVPSLDTSEPCFIVSLTVTEKAPKISFQEHKDLPSGRCGDITGTEFSAEDGVRWCLENTAGCETIPMDVFTAPRVHGAGSSMDLLVFGDAV